MNARRAELQSTSELQCAVCYEIMETPTSLPCGHSFCADCVRALHTDHGLINCPSCRAPSRPKRGQQGFELPENKQLKAACDHVREAKGCACPAHPTNQQRYYCTACDQMCCDRCAIVGEHKGHPVEELPSMAASSEAALGVLERSIATRLDGIQKEHGRVDAIFHGLKYRVNQMADEVIESVKQQQSALIGTLCSRQRDEHSAAAAPAVDIKEATESIARMRGALPRMEQQGSELRQLQASVGALAAPRECSADAAAAFFEAQASFQKLQQLRAGIKGCIEESFQVFVSQGGESILCSVKPATSVNELKAQIYGKAGIVPARQLLLRAGRPLDDELPLGAQHISKDCQLDLRLRAHSYVAGRMRTVYESRLSKQSCES